MFRFTKGIILSLIISSSLWAGITIKGGAGLNGSFDKEYWGEETKTSMSYQGGLEIQKNLSKYLSIGFGGVYHQGARLEKIGDTSTKGTDENSPLFDIVQPYIVTELHLPLTEDIEPYLKLNGGFSYNMDNTLSEERNIKVNNGYYFGGGLGVEAKKLIFEVMYEINQATITIDSVDKKTDYSRISAFIGIRF